MNKTKLMAILIPLLFLAASARAQTFYQGADYVSINYSESGGYEADLKGLRYKIGVRATPNFAFEGHIAKGIGSDTVDVSGVDVKLEMGNAIGFYMLAIFPLRESSPAEKEDGKLYAIFGYTHGSATASVYNLSITESESDLSYGIGGEVLFSKHFAGTIEYMQFIDKSDFEYSGFGFGFKIYF